MNNVKQNVARFLQHGCLETERKVTQTLGVVVDQDGVAFPHHHHASVHLFVCFSIQKEFRSKNGFRKLDLPKKSRKLFFQICSARMRSWSCSLFSSTISLHPYLTPLDVPFMLTDWPSDPSLHRPQKQP